MNNDTFSFLFSLVLVISLVILLITTAIFAKNKTKTLDFLEKSIPNFSVDLYFDPYPQTVNVSNEYDCDAKSLRVCDINNPTTLFGCKELAVRCQHFNKDTEYLAQGETHEIPRNKRENEGYALAISTIAEGCNPYHGDFTLVALNADSNEYMLICTCKNPGYIGNEDVLGSCTTVNICEGKIDDIDQPLNRINCVCDSREKNLRYSDGLPVCKPLSVKEANEKFSDWSNLVPWNSERLINIEVFNKTIADNLNTSRLLDPCRNSIHDTSVEIPYAKYNNYIRTCSFKDFGLPLEVGILEPVKQTSDDPNRKLITIDGGLITEQYNSIRLTDNVAGIRKIGSLNARLPFSKEYRNENLVSELPRGIGFSETSQIYLSMDRQMIGGKCKGLWPRYNCRLSEYFSYNLNGVPKSGYRPAPPSFLWMREPWADSESIVSNGVQIPPEGLYLVQEDMTKIRDLWNYGVEYAWKGSSNLNGLLSFALESDYDIHKQVLT